MNLNYNLPFTLPLNSLDITCMSYFGVRHLSHSIINDPNKGKFESVFAWCVEKVCFVAATILMRSSLKEKGESTHAQTLIVYCIIEIVIDSVSYITRNVKKDVSELARLYARAAVVGAFAMGLFYCGAYASLAFLIAQVAISKLPKHSISRLFDQSVFVCKRVVNIASLAFVPLRIQSLIAVFAMFLPQAFQAFSLRIPKKSVNSDIKIGDARKGVEVAYCTDMLTEASRRIYSPKIEGREKEIRLLISRLLCPRSNSIVITGDAGSGKTALVEELARRIVYDDETRRLLPGYKLFRLNLEALLAGPGYVGVFEQNIAKFKRSIAKAGRHSVVFIDEAHMLNGAGRGADKQTHLPDFLKSEVESGKITLIMCSTNDEYRCLAQGDPAFDSRFLRLSLKSLGKRVADKAIHSYVSDLPFPFAKEAMELLLREAKKKKASFRTAKQLIDTAASLAQVNKLKRVTEELVRQNILPFLGKGEKLPADVAAMYM